MAAATTLPTVSPKQLGKQLRSVRRRKGLSLSEVARGAGLSRRELVAYERGKVEIPESDLWVIAGSCGVDVTELVPPTDPRALPSGPESIEDSITQLRPSRPGGSLQRHLDTLYALRSLPPGSIVQLQEGERAAMADSLGGDPATIERRLVETMRVSKDEAKRLRVMILPDAPRYSPLALDAPTPAPVPEPEPAYDTPLYDAPAYDTPVCDAPAYDPTAGFATNGVAAPDLARVRDPDLAAAPVDVFEELAKLPEPVALPDPHAAGHDMFSPPPEPVTVAASAEAGASGPFAAWSSMRSALPEPSGPVVVEPAAPSPEPGGPAFGASHAPPIDVVGRVDAPTTPNGSWGPPPVNGSGGYAPPGPRADLRADLGELVDLVETGTQSHEDEPTRTDGGWEAWWTPRSTQGDVDGVDAFAPWPAVTPVMPEAVVSEAPPVQMIEFVDDFVGDAPSAAWPATEPFVGVPAASEPPAPDVPAPPTFDSFTPAAYEAPVDAPMTDAERYAAGVFAPAPTDTEPDVRVTHPEWTASPVWASRQPTDAEATPVAAEPPETNGWSRNGLVTPDEQRAVPQDAGSETPWGHRPEPDASSTGFYVDWGSEDATSGAVTDTTDDRWVAAALDTQVGDTVAAPSAQVVEAPQDFAPGPVSPVFDDTSTFETSTFETSTSAWVTTDAPAPISWRPLADTVLAAVAAEMATRDSDTVDAPTFEPEPVDEFVTAGEEWELGNALPLVEVRGQGGLVMRRADERWALADVHSATSFALEVEVDFRSGPGFGVLFRAATDADGHMSGYSFDVDPIHEGGSYLVRQWHADRELWNPIAHVPAIDPSDMHGMLTLRVVVVGDSVTASVNGAVVLSVDSLERACAERNREPAAGDRVGIQAWSSSDLVIDTLRVAER